jgi:nicotinamide mononucleotide adenylyltransferase
MALSESVEASLREAEASLRNALAYAARQEKPFVAKHIADMVMQIDNLISTDALIDKIENRKDGDSGFFGTFFGGES